MQQIVDYNTFFTADLHFGHGAMLHPDKCKRPYATTDEMNQDMVHQWNAQVSNQDHVFILGDVSFMSNSRTLTILRALNGHKYLVEGNHDKHSNLEIKSMYEWIKPFYETKINGQPIVMCHYAMRVWNKSHFGAWQLHGHSHGTLEAQGMQLDVGVDSKVPRSGLLYSFFDVQAYMKTRGVHVVDHHKPREIVTPTT